MKPQWVGGVVRSPTDGHTERQVEQRKVQSQPENVNIGSRITPNTRRDSKWTKKLNVNKRTNKKTMRILVKHWQIPLQPGVGKTNEESLIQLQLK